VDEIVSTKRVELEGYITDELNKQFDNNSLKLVQFVLRDIHFSDEYATAVEQKQIAQQQALQAAYVVQSKQQEAQQAIETAKGQAESVKIAAQAAADARLIQAGAEAEALQKIADALDDNPDLLTYLYVTKLAPNVQVMYLPSGQPYLITLPTPVPNETTPAP
jgi:regulator of protease activity HflC (stomatin/prohibitin superfamily)